MSRDILRKQRFERTLNFVNRHLDLGSRILDLGVPNELSGLLINHGYDVYNTDGEDLDSSFQKYVEIDVDCVTSFEIFEHMLAPFNILSALRTQKLIATVPLKLWFAEAYWNEKDIRDRHYHEFEIKQFNFLLERTGWTLESYEVWKSFEHIPTGIRPLLRRYYPRYYFVYCTKK